MGACTSKKRSHEGQGAFGTLLLLDQETMSRREKDEIYWLHNAHLQELWGHKVITVYWDYLYVKHWKEDPELDDKRMKRIAKVIKKHRVDKWLIY